MLSNSGVNKIFLIGHIGKEPRHHVSPDQEYTCFPVVTNENIRKDSESFEHTEWHQIKLPEKLMSSLVIKPVKGQLIYLEGKIQTRSFVDEQGIKRYKTEIMASKLELLNNIPVEV